MLNVNSNKNEFVTSCTSDKAFSIRGCCFSTVLATEILKQNTDMEKYLNIKKNFQEIRLKVIKGTYTFLLDFL